MSKPRGLQVDVRVTAEGVLHVTWAGVATAPQLQAARREIAADLGPWRPLAIVSSYARAVLCLSHADLMALMSGRALEDLPAVPAAVVASGPNATTLGRYALIARAAGLSRQVLPHPVAAAAWVAQALASARLSRPPVPRRRHLALRPDA